MKKIYFLLIALCFFTNVNAQIINIPDPVFKAKLLAANTSNTIAFQYNLPIKIDTNNNGEIELNEALQVDKLDVSNSNIINMDGLSYFANLITLNCDNVLITQLDISYLPKVSTLYASNNQNLKNLNIKNGLIYFNIPAPTAPPLGIGNAEFKSCQKLQYVCTSEDRINNGKTYLSINYPSGSVTLNSYCSFTPGGAYYNIQGNQKYDGNNNGCDLLDFALPNLKYNISDGTNSGSLISNTTENYNILVQAGTHTLTPVFENPSYFAASPSTATVTFPAHASPFTQNFCVTANGVHPDLEVTLLPIIGARPGFDAKYKVIYKNKGNTTQSGTVNLTFDDSVLDLVVANPATSNQSLNNLSWNFTNLLPFESREILVTLNVNSPLEIPAVNAGSILNYTATITSPATDEMPNDNTFAYNQTVVNSFDPNDITCLEGATVTTAKVGDYVHYMIRFENNGTANAQNIVVKNMVDLAKYDINSIVPIKGSHSFVTNITAGNKVEFIFENINLPFDDANNDGYVSFKIKTLSSLAAGDTVSKNASIYFDYNAPIVTNTATTTIQTLGTKDFEFSSYFSLFPNPAATILNISSKTDIEISSISIYNTLGQIVLVIPNAQNTKFIDVSGLKTGTYFIKINSDKGSSNSKFIKE